MYAEYGARIVINGLVGIPDATTGTIVSDVPLFGHAPVWNIDRDDTREIITLHVQEFDVTQSPSESAYSLTSRWSVDECLDKIGQIVAIDGRNTARDRYTAALIFELYRLNYHAETVVQIDADGWGSGDDYGDDYHDADETERGDYWPQDDGYGSPVYYVED